MTSLPAALATTRSSEEAATTSSMETRAPTSGFSGGRRRFRWDQGDGSDRVEGGSGFDEMLFNGFGAQSSSLCRPMASVSSFTRVQGNIVMDLDDIEKVTVNALGGADTITINDPSGTGITDIDINLGVGGLGDGAADTIFINDGADVTVVDNGNGNLTIAGLSGATVPDHRLRGVERSLGYRRHSVRLLSSTNLRAVRLRAALFLSCPIQRIG